ncbi:NACHT, LRR and PYD domains-containing protein 12-like [Pimephales promelas]|uniref:NACHT, LRR and PYD domains-containing protein 12-like n=1 Tax=Pimephales promelas TaxID=90988 RepID=UPI00195583D6|nr:NACHT, LRR and PYD domains-containing protein 12-like [Pimephales promelas]
MWKPSNVLNFFWNMAEGFFRNLLPVQGRSTHNERVTNAKELESQKSKEKNTSRDPCGLINQGMTCYLNAVLQTLFMTDEFRHQVTSSNTCKSPEGKALADLFRSLQCERTAVSTEEVTKVLNITDVFEQQDAAEYLQMILHRVPEPSEIFRGAMETSTVCSYCKHSNDEKTDFLSIPLSIDARGKCDVTQALMEYLGIHDMSGVDQLYCVTCDSMRDMETVNDIQKWPDILTLQLKRFEMGFIGNKLYYWKNECYVKIPPNLHIDSVKYGSSPEYELYAIINHHGSFISGHYVTIAKSRSGHWYNFNDHSVTKMDYVDHWINGGSTSAYLLMYRKVTKEVASSGQDEETNDPQTDTSEVVRNNPQSKNPEEDHTKVKVQIKQSMINTESCKKSSVTKEVASSGQDEKTNDPQTDTSEVVRNNPKSKNPEEDHTKVKVQIKPSMINTESSKKSSESESYSKMFKQRLKEAFQCLNEEILRGERQKLNDVFIEPHIIEEHDSYIRDKRPIKCNDIFEGKKIRTVLMKGEAGIGKTVAVQKFVLDWAEEKSNHDIEYIFPIPFQKLNIIRETVKEVSFMELLQRCCENTGHLNPESRVMLIFDGLNEFKLPLDFQTTKKIKDPIMKASVSDLLTNLIMGNLLPNAHIWITSRPAAANQIPAQFIDRVTEIQGFNGQQKKEYFRKSISDQSMANKVISHIRKSPRINSMCYLPDYCRIIAAMPEEMFRTDETGSETLTQMYSRLLLAQTDLNPERRDTIVALGNIAFHWLVNSKSLFCDEDLKQRGLRDESVLKKSMIIKRIEDKSECKLFCFVNHRTQEFLAALYVTEIINRGEVCQLRDLSSLKLEFGEQSFAYFYVLQHIIDKTLQKQMELFFCFLLGFRLESTQIALKEILTQRSSNSSSSQEIIQHIKTMIMSSSSETAVKSSLLLDCLKELDERYLIQEMKTQLKSGLGLSPDEFSALMFVLLNSEEQLDYLKSHQSEKLKIRPVVKTSGEHEEYQFGLGVRACADLRSNPSHLRELDLGGNFLGDSGIKQLSDLLKMCKLEKLRLRFCFINEEACAVLSSALRSNPSHLRELDLSKNNITESGMQQLSDLLKHPQCKLEKLGLYACLIKEEDCAVLTSALRSNPSHLKELDLSGNDIKYSGLKLLSSLLADHQCKLEKLSSQQT